MSNTRRLNAILFADISGYTSIMQSDERLAQEMIQKFRLALETHVSKHEGRIINFMGDGCLCVFDSSVNAIECALALQQNYVESPSIPVRIGIHSGDVYFENESVFGDSVNVASRIESIGIAGSVLFSERIYNDIVNHSKFKTTTLGEVRFKNVDRPIKVYALNNHPLKVPDASQLQGKILKRKKTKRLNYSVYIPIGIVLLAALFLYNKFKMTDPEAESRESITVAVTDFVNRTELEKFDLLSEISADRIINGISQLGAGRVVSGETIRDFEKIMVASSGNVDRASSLVENFGVTRWVEGQIYRLGSQYLLECTITDPQSKEVIYAMPTVSFDESNPMIGIEEMKQHVLSALVVDQDKKLNLLLETKPPKYEAYKMLLTAKKYEDDSIMLTYLEKALEIDSNYFEPKLLRISANYNLGKFDKADSLAQVLEQETISCLAPFSARIFANRSAFG